MKPTMTIDTNVFDADSIVVCFDRHDDRSDEPTHVGGDVLSETTVPYNFIPVEEL